MDISRDRHIFIESDNWYIIMQAKLAQDLWSVACHINQRAGKFKIILGSEVVVR